MILTYQKDLNLNLSCFDNLRFKLIEFLSGKSVVIINAKIDIINESTGICLEINVPAGTGCCLHNSVLPVTDGRILKISENK